MKRAFRDAYSVELGLLKERAAEFSEDYPGLADRLGGLLEENLDPTVAGLLEGSAFMAARVQVKMGEEYRTFTHELLDQVFPDALAPTPSLMMVQGQIPDDAPEIEKGLSFEPGAYMDARFQDAQKRVNCRYRLAAPMTLWPLEIADAAYHAGIGPIGSLGQEIAPNTKGGLVIDLACSMAGEDGTAVPLTLNALSLDELTLHLNGPMDEAALLYEQIFCDCTRVSLRWHSAQGDPVFAHLSPDQIERIGFAEGERLFPHQDRMFDGFARLREFFAFPRKFLGVRLKGLSNILRHIRGNAVQVIFEFGSTRQRLSARLEPQHLMLNAAPAVNLFTEMSSSLHIKEKHHAHVVTPNSSPITHYEVHEITDVWAHFTDQRPKARVHPLYALPPNGEDPRQSFYFTSRRKPRRATLNERRHGASRNGYKGTETYLSFYQPPNIENLQRLQVQTLCSNRHLPEYLPIAGGRDDFHMCENQGVALACISGPTPPRDSLADLENGAAHRVTSGETYWRLLSYLSLSTFGVQSRDDKDSAAALREMLSLFADLSDSVNEAQIAGVRRLETRPITHTIAHADGYHTARGLEVRVTFDESEFESSGIVPLGAVLDRFFAEYAAVNSFTQTVICSKQRGEITRFAPCTGAGPLL